MESIHPRNREVQQDDERKLNWFMNLLQCLWR